MSDSVKPLVAVATYNEIDTLPHLVDDVWRCMPEADVLVVDDKSPDGTGQWCREKSRQDARLTCIEREGKLGLGTALAAALEYAAQRRDRYAYVVTMDADLSHSPERLPELVRAMAPPGLPRVDVAIGSRYIAGGTIEGWPLSRHLMSRSVNFVSRWFLGLPPHDCSSGYRCYRTEILARLDFRGVSSHGYSFEEEILWRLHRLGARFAEVPIHFVNRRRGSSKINPRELFTSASALMRLATGRLWRSEGRNGNGSKREDADARN